MSQAPHTVLLFDRDGGGWAVNLLHGRALRLDHTQFVQLAADDCASPLAETAIEQRLLETTPNHDQEVYEALIAAASKGSAQRLGFRLDVLDDQTIERVPAYVTKHRGKHEPPPSPVAVRVVLHTCGASQVGIVVQVYWTASRQTR